MATPVQAIIRNQSLQTMVNFFFLFLGAITRVSSSAQFIFVRQYFQSATQEYSRISADRVSTKTQNCVLFIKCNVARKSDQYTMRSYLILLSCIIELMTRVANAAATNSNRGIVKAPPIRQTLHLLDKNKTETVL